MPLVPRSYLHIKLGVTSQNRDPVLMVLFERIHTLVLRSQAETDSNMGSRCYQDGMLKGLIIGPGNLSIAHYYAVDIIVVNIASLGHIASRPQRKPRSSGHPEDSYTLPSSSDIGEALSAFRGLNRL